MHSKRENNLALHSRGKLAPALQVSFTASLHGVCLTSEIINDKTSVALCLFFSYGKETNSHILFKQKIIQKR